MTRLLVVTFKGIARPYFLCSFLGPLLDVVIGKCQTGFDVAGPRNGFADGRCVWFGLHSRWISQIQGPAPYCVTGIS